MDLKSYPYLGLPVQTCRCLRMSTSPVINTKAIFWTSSWPFHRNQHIIPFLHTMAKGGKQSIRRLEPQSCLRAGWQLLLLLELAAGWAALPQWHFSCKPTHAAEGCPQDWECMCACMSRHAPPQQVSKAAPVQGHVPTQSCCVWVSAGRRAKSHYMCLPDSLTLKSSSKNPWQGILESFGGWHTSACMSLATKIYYRAVTEAYLFALIS